MSAYINGKKIVTDDMIGGQYYRGGENLLPGTAFKSLEDLSDKGWDFSRKEHISITNHNSIILDALNNTNTYVDIKFPVAFDSAYNYIFSLQMLFMLGKSDGAKIFLVEQKKDGSNCSNYQDHQQTLNNNYNRKNNVFSFKPINIDSYQASLVIRANPGTKFEFSTPKFEMGELPTIWTPSPKDF